MLNILRLRILGLATFDLGEIKDVGEIRIQLSETGEFSIVGNARRNPLFFDVEYCKPLLFICAQDGASVSGVGHSDQIPEAYKDKITTLEALLRGAHFREEVYISSSGIGCVLFRIGIRRPMTTALTIDLTNLLIKYELSLRLQNGTSFRLGESLEAWRNRLTAFTISPRTHYSRRYSVIHLIELPEEVFEAAKEAGVPLYQHYQREFHSLGVRTIEQWQERYPSGGVFPDMNSSLSPMGVLIINMRNTLIYEYPFDETEIQDLYYAAIVELRIWDLLATVQLQYVQQILARHEAERYSDVTPEFIERLQRRTLAAFNEFDGFYLSTSKRARNFYLEGYRVFHIKELLGILRDKTDQLGSVLLSLQKRSNEGRQRALVSQQRDLLMETVESAQKETPTKAVVNLIAVFLGVSLALTLVETFQLDASWRLPMMAGFALIYLLVFFAARSSSNKMTCRVRQDRHVHLPVDKISAVSNLLVSGTNRDVKELVEDRNAASLLLNHRVKGGRIASRADVFFGVASATEDFNVLISLESTLTFRRRNGCSEQAISRAVDADFRRVLELLAGTPELRMRPVRPIEIAYYDQRG